MPQIRSRLKLTRPQTEFEKAFETEILSAWFELSRIVNAGLDFVDNFNLEKKTVTDTGAVNTEFSVTHTLKRVPTGYIVIRRDKAGVVYDSGTAFTNTTIYLKCSTANTNITLFIF